MPRPSRERPRLQKTSQSGGGTPTLEQWVKCCRLATHNQASLYAGCRKIIRPARVIFPRLDDSLQLHHAGFTNNKMAMLTRNYLHEESRNVALRLWDKRRGQRKYGSVGFSCYKVLMKGDVKGATPRGSVFGPCIQSVVISWINDEQYSLDVFYRTTEFYKKFAPDVVFLRDVLLTPFDFSNMNLNYAAFHFANATIHPMYWVTIAPHFEDPVEEIASIKEKYFRNWIIKWTARYLCKEFEHGIQKFSQALRVRQDALKRIDKDKLRALQKYLRTNHPGYGRVEEEDDDD